MIYSKSILKLSITFSILFSQNAFADNSNVPVERLLSPESRSQQEPTTREKLKVVEDGIKQMEESERKLQAFTGYLEKYITGSDDVVQDFILSKEFLASMATIGAVSLLALTRAKGKASSSVAAYLGVSSLGTASGLGMASYLIHGSESWEFRKELSGKSDQELTEMYAIAKIQLEAVRKAKQLLIDYQSELLNCALKPGCNNSKLPN